MDRITNLMLQCPPWSGVVTCMYHGKKFYFMKINNMEIKYFQPFGKRSGSVFDNRTLYKQVLLELARVVRCKGRAILLTYDRKSMTMVS